MRDPNDTVRPASPTAPLVSVWAPDAERVAVVLGDEVRPMARAARPGWWQLAVPGLAHGDRYAFRVDGGPPRPDPRSGWQPDGVHGASAHVDHRHFAWTDQHWRGVSLPGAVLYELHVGTFSDAGTFDGAVEHLDHLVELGVDAVELLPVAEFPGERGWGYDGVDLFAPHHAYGGPDALKRLVDACHARGLGVVFDVVYNHLGPAGNYLAEFGPYFSERHQTNWGAAVNLDGPGSDEVRRFVLDNALQWLRDYHGDGLRLDAVHALVDDSAVHLLEQLGAEVRSLAAHVRKPLFVIAESDLNDPVFVRATEAGGYGLDAAWADEWHHALHGALTGERSGYYEDFGDLASLAKALRQAWVFDGRWSPHRGRTHGRPPTGLDGSRFVVSAQNHDQVGNRAAGERLHHLTSLGRAKVAAALLLTSPFVPLLFQGEEWAASTPFQYFTAHEDPDLGRAVSEGRRHEFSSFGWAPDDVPDPQDPATFERCVLRWPERHRGVHAEMLAWYRELLALRRARAELTDGRLDRVRAEADADAGTVVVHRGPIAVVAALGPGPVHVTLTRDGEVTLLAASDPAVRVEDAAVELVADSVAIVDLGVAADTTPGAPAGIGVRDAG